MVIDLKPEQQRVIDLAVRSGANPEEVMEQAFEIIREQLENEDWMVGEHEAISQQIERGFTQSEGGDLLDADAALELLRHRRIERLQSAQ